MDNGCLTELKLEGSPLGKLEIGEGDRGVLRGYRKERTSLWKGVKFTPGARGGGGSGWVKLKPAWGT